jgi:hypothetical protein
MFEGYTGSEFGGDWLRAILAASLVVIGDIFLQHV